MATTWTVQQVTDNIAIDGIIRAQVRRPGIEADKPPRFSFDVRDVSGVGSYKLAIGKEVSFFRNGRRRMLGVVDDITPKGGSDGRILHVEGMSKGYKMLEDKICDDYDYDEDGDAATTRDAMTVNPWAYYIHRKTGGTLSTTTGLESAVDGVEFDDIVESLVGSKFVHQIDFQDNSYLMGSQVYATGNNFQVHMDKSVDKRPYLQRVKLVGGTVNNGAASVQTVPLVSGDRNIDKMATLYAIIGLIVYQPMQVSGVDDFQAVNQPTVDYCVDGLNGTGSRSFGTAGGSLIQNGSYVIQNFRGTGLTARYGISFVGSGYADPTIALRINGPTNGSMTRSEKIEYVKIISIHSSSGVLLPHTGDTGLTFTRALPDYLPYVLTSGLAIDDIVSNSFQIDSDSPVTMNTVTCCLSRVGSPTGNVIVRVSPTAGGSGGVTATVTGSVIPIIASAGVYGVFELALSASITLDPDTTYYLTFENAGSPTNYFQVHQSSLGSDLNPSNQVAARLSYLPSNLDDAFVETDLQTFNRLEALERVRKLSISDTDLNTGAHFDAFIDEDLEVHWLERRGNDISTHEYSFGAENVKELDHQFFGADIAYQTIAFGAGSGSAQTRIVSKTEFSSGGLYDADRDWTVNPSTALHRKAAGVRRFIDPNESSASTLLRKARAFHKLKRDPVETVTVEIISETIEYFDAGDSILLADVPTRTNGLQRVVDLTFDWSGRDREKVTVKLGEPAPDTSDHIAANNSQGNVLTVRSQPRIAKSSSSSPPIFFDKTSYGVFSFNVDGNGKKLSRVSLQLTSQPYTVPNVVAAVSTFKGDTPAADPVYASKVQFAVDPTLGANGLPSTFATQIHPDYFGGQTTTTTRVYDVTGYLRIDGNGIVAEGQHQVYFLSASDTNNTNGLSCVSITALMEFEEG